MVVSWASHAGSGVDVRLKGGEWTAIVCAPSPIAKVADRRRRRQPNVPLGARGPDARCVFGRVEVEVAKVDAELSFVALGAAATLEALGHAEA